MSAPEGHCWLCNKYGKLTKEHIPPEKAFNDFPLLYQKVAERSRQVGVVQWEGEKTQRGLYFRSLCERCNNRYGRLYGGAYVDLVRQVAERIGNVRDFHKMSVLAVKRPLPILKQVMLQFVTANGPSFVQANPWVAPFIRSQTQTQIPREVYVYLFASNASMNRKSGVSAHVHLNTGRTKVVSEFTFWPLGTVISFGEEEQSNLLTPIHHWAQYSFDYSGSVDLDLSVNPVASPYPVDFRPAAEVESARSKGDDPIVKRMTEEKLQEMSDKVVCISGESEKDSWIYSGHPSTFSKVNKRTEH
jgi:hypothetical protein